ncbi:hypothetical protein PybrP1_007213 [[Pythium] brassicae (nom. inval.)]|nr:hypothetical protein PybrP1_007213 [[Pythium] brassicae (nom. inval.)]
MNLRIATKILIVAAAVASAFGGVHARPRVHPGVHRALRQDGAVNIMVVMRGSTRRALESIDAASFASRGDKIEQLLPNIDEIREEEVAELNDGSDTSSGSSDGAVGVEWGVEQIGAREVWAKGFTGQGIRELLVGSVERASLTVPTAWCGNDSSSSAPSWPNNDYGNGRVNVRRALERLLQG